MRKLNRFLSWSLLGAASLILVGCPPKSVPTRVSLVFDAGANVNPDVSGQPLSVVVRVYQLKDKGRLETADYNAIWKSDKEALSDDLIQRQERIIQPGTQEMMEIQAEPMAAYLGVVALFRVPSGDTWRRIVPLTKGKAQKFNLSLREQSIELTSAGTR